MKLYSPEYPENKPYEAQLIADIKKFMKEK